MKPRNETRLVVFTRCIRWSVFFVAIKQLITKEEFYCCWSVISFFFNIRLMHLHVRTVTLEIYSINRKVNNLIDILWKPMKLLRMKSYCCWGSISIWLWLLWLLWLSLLSSSLLYIFFKCKTSFTKQKAIQQKRRTAQTSITQEVSIIFEGCKRLKEYYSQKFRSFPKFSNITCNCLCFDYNNVML